MELIQGKQFLIPEFESELDKLSPEKSVTSFSTTVFTDDYIKLSTVLRNREQGKSTQSKHKCGAGMIHDHKSGFTDLDNLPKPKVELAFKFTEIEKFDAGDYEKDVWALKSKEEKLEYVQKSHVQGNLDFKQGRIEEAVVSYEKAIQIYGSILAELYPSSDEYNTTKEKEMTIVLNLCQCYIQLKKDWGKIVDYCSRIVQNQLWKDNEERIKSIKAKAYYRRAFANIEMMNKDEALVDLEEVLKLDNSIPTQKSCFKLKEKLTKYEKERDVDLKTRFKNIFSV